MSRVLVAVVLGCTVAACSSHADPTVEAGASAASTAPPTSSVSVAPSTSAVPSPVVAVTPAPYDPNAVLPSSDLVTAVYWTRPFDGSRSVSVVGYEDPASGPHPYVLYGSVTNQGGGKVGRPVVTVSVPDPSTGQPTVVAIGRVLDPQGVDLPFLGPGATADVLVVVSDPVVGRQLSAIDPILVGGTR